MGVGGGEVTQILMDARKTVFDELKQLFFESGLEVEFLKADASGLDFETVDELAASWWLRYDNYRRQFLLEVAEGPNWMQGTVKDATHVRIGEDVYTIVRSDMLPPNGTDVTWKIYCERSFQRGHTRPLY